MHPICTGCTGGTTCYWRKPYYMMVILQARDQSNFISSKCKQLLVLFRILSYSDQFGPSKSKLQPQSNVKLNLTVYEDHRAESSGLLLFAIVTSRGSCLYHCLLTELLSVRLPQSMFDIQLVLITASLVATLPLQTWTDSQDKSSESKCRCSLTPPRRPHMLGGGIF